MAGWGLALQIQTDHYVRGMQYPPLLFLHITAGMVGMVSGGGALILRKGAPRHALVGKVFVVSMLTMAATAPTWRS
jgi:uncharacterized membrane protein